MLAAGVLTWGLIEMLADYASSISARIDVAFRLGSISIAPAHAYVVFAVPVVVIAVLAGMTLFIGGVSKFKWIEDEDREWWARFGGWVLIVTVGWIALAAITLLGPPLLLAFPKLVASVGGLSGLIALVLGKSSLTAAGRAVERLDAFASWQSSQGRRAEHTGHSGDRVLCRLPGLPVIADQCGNGGAAEGSGGTPEVTSCLACYWR